LFTPQNLANQVTVYQLKQQWIN